MAFWNAPLDDPDHARNACRAALEMVARMSDLNATGARRPRTAGRDPCRVTIGIGINSGDCCVGNLGSAQRFDYSAIGDDVNVASRLEGLSKLYGVPIVVGESTAAKVSGRDAGTRPDKGQGPRRADPHLHHDRGARRQRGDADKAPAAFHAPVLTAYRDTARGRAPTAHSECP